MKNITITKITSIILLLIIITLSVLVFLNTVQAYNNILIISISVLSLITLILNFFGNNIIEKQIEVIVEKEVFIEKQDDKKEEKIKVNNDYLKLIDKKKNSTDNEKYINKQLSKIAKHFNLDQIVFYMKNNEDVFKIISRYAFISDAEIEFKEGEGLSGQVVKDKKPLYITDIPDGYITVISGLGKGNPKSLLISPVINDNEVVGVAEFASLQEIEEHDRKAINKLIEKIATNIMNVK